ncbi:MAG TPA: sigma-70 family RNA polymerase sigma factor [Candidatus Hydrogenedentes bacterium]|nr:sigma-70 family RNA polymerase sigma factor [Candidatus Hydrogenedentota bacterium]HIJ73856.1 sigma-70 family RNA polymerase sigma factor [Candidatus Hydrogenedentota bacterium]
MNGTAMTDAALLEASLAGNRQAFTGIVERYKSLVCAITYSSTGDIELSEDLAQETFVAAWRDLRRLKDLRKFRPWLCTIARHVATQAMRKRQRDVTAAAKPLEDLPDHAAADLGPRETAINKERQAVMWQALEQIPEGYRVPLILYYREGHSVQRVAQTLGLSPNAVRQRLARGRHMLKAEVAGLVEQSLERTRPGKTFSLAVLASLPKAPLPAAGGAAATAASGGQRAGGPVAKLLSRGVGLGAKHAVAAGVVSVALGVTAAFYVYASRTAYSKSSPVVEAKASEYAETSELVGLLSHRTSSEVPELAGAVDLAGAADLPGAADLLGAASVEAQAGATPSDAASEEPAVGPRVLHFPEDRSLGTLKIQVRPRTRQYGFDDPQDEWDELGPAQGDVVVPADTPVRLRVCRAALRDLSPLLDLGSHDLYGLDISWTDHSAPNPDATIMPHIRGLTGLKVLHLAGWDVTGKGLRITEKGLRYIQDFKELEDFLIGSGSLGDTGLLCIGGLESLRVLSIMGMPDTFTEAGLAHLAKLTSLEELRIKLDENGGRGLRHLVDLPRLKHLALVGSMYGDRDLHYLKNAKSLKKLQFFDIQLTDAGLAHLSPLKTIEELRFVRIPTITDAGILHLAPLRSLKKLELGNAEISDAGLARVAAMKSLERLSLRLDRITDTGLAFLSELEGLQELDMLGRMYPEPHSGPITDKGLGYLSRLKNLEKLSFCSGTGVTDAGIEFLAGLDNLNNLSLYSTGITDNALQTLATMKSLGRLNIQCHSSRNITVSGVNHLNALTNLEELEVSPVVQDYAGLDLSGLRNLKKLDIWLDGGLRDEDMACLAELTGLIRLQPGYSTTFSDAGMAHLKNLKALEYLYVGGDMITDKGLSYLADKRRLKALSIQGGGTMMARGVADITERGLRHLEDLDALRILVIETRHYLSPAAVNRLYRELPSLVIFNAEPVLAAVSAAPASEDE